MDAEGKQNIRTGIGAANREARCSGIAIASLVISLLGVPIIGLILGFVALNKIKRSGGLLRGRGVAVGGIILSCIMMILGSAIGVVLLRRARERAQKIVCFANLKTIGYAVNFCHSDEPGSNPPTLAAMSYLGDPNLLHCPKDRVAGCSYTYCAVSRHIMGSYDYLLAYERFANHKNRRHVLRADTSVSLLDDDAFRQLVEEENKWRAKYRLPRLLIDGVTLRGRQDAQTDEPNARSKKDTSQEKVNAYIEYALELHAKGEKKQASWALQNALLFNRRTEDLSKAAAECPIPRSGISDPELAKAMSGCLKEGELPGVFGKVHATIDPTEAAMLFDKELVGTGACNIMEGTFGTGREAKKLIFFLFSHSSRLGMTEIKQRYGEPQTLLRTEQGSEYALYGRFLLVRPVESTITLVMRLIPPREYLEGPKPKAGVAGTWKYVTGDSTIRLTFSQDGSVTWTRDESGAMLLPVWLFYGKWKTAEGKLTVYGKFHGEDKSQGWTYSLEDGGSKLRLVPADGKVTTMSRIDGSQ
jgi:hypothetical protein